MKIKDFELERYFSIHEFSARYQLCESDCESFSIQDILSMGETYEDEFRSLNLGYTDTAGDPALRNEISKLYEAISTEQIIVFSGAEEGIFVFMNTLLEKGDHVIVQSPAYQSLFEIANTIGAEVTKWEMHEEGTWGLDISILEDSIKENTKLIVLNTPHNPTGHVIPDDMMKKIVKIAKENNIYIFSDEVYRFLTYDGGYWMPSNADLYEKCFSLGVMSKSFGLAGLRIGWIASKDTNLMKEMGPFKDYTSICNSAPSEMLSIMALRSKDKILNRNRSIVRDNMDLFEEFLAKHSDKVSWSRPQGGSVGFPKLLGGRSSSEFANDLLKRKGVLTVPSKLFAFGDSHFRVGFGRLDFPLALKKMDEYMDGPF